jgi:hypothetical protein
VSGHEYHQDCCPLQRRYVLIARTVLGRGIHDYRSCLSGPFFVLEGAPWPKQADTVPATRSLAADADEEAVGVAGPEPVLGDAAAGISNGFGKAPQ